MTMLANNSGSGFLSAGGSYVTYIDRRTGAEAVWTRRLPLRSDADATAAPFSLVLEKVNPDKAHCSFSSTPHYLVEAETVRFQLSAELSKTMGGSTLSAWRSNFGTSSYFQKGSDVQISASGGFSVDVAPDELVTLTNTVGQRNGNTTVPPPAAPFPAVHADDFEKYAVGQEADYFAQASGAFEVATLGGNRVLKQSGVGFPVLWLRDDVRPATQLGAQNWYATNVSAMVAVPAGQQGQGAFIAAHINERNGNTHWPGCFLGINQSHWWVGEQLADLGGHLATTGPLPPGTSGGTSGDGGSAMHWRQLELRLTGSASTQGTVTALVDGRVVVDHSASVCSSLAGTVGLGSIAYSPAFFDNFSVSAAADTPPPAPAPGPGPMPKPPAPATCGAPKAGDPLLMLGCGDAHTNHTWTMADGKLQLQNTDLCLSINAKAAGKEARGMSHLTRSAGGCSGKCAALAPCAKAPKWTDDVVPGKYTPVGTGDQHCLDVDASIKPDGHHLELYKCNDAFRGGANQRFELTGGELSSKLWAQGEACVSVCGTMP